LLATLATPVTPLAHIFSQIAGKRNFHSWAFRNIPAVLKN